MCFSQFKVIFCGCKTLFEISNILYENYAVCSPRHRWERISRTVALSAAGGIAADSGVPTDPTGQWAGAIIIIRLPLQFFWLLDLLRMEDALLNAL